VNTQQANQDVWVFDLARHTLTRLTTEGRNATPVWSPDGTRIVYRSSVVGPDNLFWQLSDGSGTPERLTTSENNQVPASWSPDGRALAFYTLKQNASDIWLLSLGVDRRSHPLLQTTFSQAGVDFSPDGSWLAYYSNDSGREEVYIQPYPGPGSRRQISTDGGISPVWRRDGRELFFVEPVQPDGNGRPEIRMMAVPVTTQPVLHIGSAKLLFEGQYVSTIPARAYDVTPDGQRFLMLQEKPQPPLVVKEMVLVQNWVEELKRRVPVK